MKLQIAHPLLRLHLDYRAHPEFHGSIINSQETWNKKSSRCYHCCLQSRLHICEMNGEMWAWSAYYTKELCSLLLGMIMTFGYIGKCLHNLLRAAYPEESRNDMRWCLRSAELLKILRQKEKKEDKWSKCYQILIIFKFLHIYAGELFYSCICLKSFITKEMITSHYPFKDYIISKGCKYYFKNYLYIQ